MFRLYLIPYCVMRITCQQGLLRETSDPSGTAQNEQNNKPRTAPDQISDIIWRGSKCLGVLYLVHV